MRFLIAFSFSLTFFLLSCKESQNPKKTTIDIDYFNTVVKDAENLDLSAKIRLDKANEAISLSKILNRDSTIFKAFTTKMILLDELKMDNNYLKLNQDIIKWAKHKNDKKYLANINFILGKFYYERYKSDSAYYYFNQSKIEFTKLKDKEGVAKNSINIAMILNDVASYFESEKSSLEALENVKNNSEHPYLTPIYNNLAVSSGSLLNYEEELYWYSKALKLTTDPYYTISIKHNQAVALTLLKKYDQAIKSLSEIENDTILKDHPEIKARIIDNLAYARWLKDKNIQVVDKYNEAAEIFTSIEDYFGLSVTLDHLIEYYTNIDHDKAMNYANQKYKISILSNNTESKLNALKRIVVLQPNKLKIDEYIKLSDSLQFTNSNSKYQFAKLGYDADQNRNEIQNLTLIKTQNELELERAKIYTILIGFIVFIIILSFIIYLYLSRQKRKQELLKTIYKTEVQLSQKLHDELANDLFSTMTLVDSLSFENISVKDKLIHNLDHIYSQTRNISRQNNTIDLVNFKSELDTMLGSYKSDDISIVSKGINLIAWEKINDQIKIVIYRVLMELMTNMKKHSNCSLVVIKFEKDGKNLMINYNDNGVLNNLNGSSKKNGIKNVENRIKDINGTINFDLTKGYKVFIHIPI